MKSHIKTTVKSWSLCLCLLKNTAPSADQLSQRVKSTWSIQHKVDRNNVISMIRDTVKYSHKNILNQAKPNYFQDKLNKKSWRASYCRIFNVHNLFLKFAVSLPTKHVVTFPCLHVYSSGQMSSRLQMAQHIATLPQIYFSRFLRFSAQVTKCSVK